MVGILTVFVISLSFLFATVNILAIFVISVIPLYQGWHTGNVRDLPVMIWYDFKSDGILPAEVSNSGLSVITVPA